MRILFITVGDPSRLTGGYLYHREVFARLRARGVGIDEVVASGADVAEQLAAAPALGARIDPPAYDAIVVDALARAVAAPWLDAWRALRPLVAMVHELPGVAGQQAQAHTAADNGPGSSPQPPPAGMEHQPPSPPDADEQAWEAPLLRADRLITVSADGAAILRARGVPAERIVIASGGFDRLLGGAGGAGARGRGGAGDSDGQRTLPVPPSERSERVPPPASGASGPAPQTALCVAQWISRKGLVELVRAWGGVARPGWALELVGEDDADPAYAELVRAAIAAAPAGSVLVRGPLSDAELRDAYGRAAFFALPSRYEGYGIAFAEALAHGLPVVACAVGPVPELVGPGAGLLVPLIADAGRTDAGRRALDDRRPTTDDRRPTTAAGRADGPLPSVAGGRSSLPGRPSSPQAVIDEPALAAALARLMDDAALRAAMARAARARAASLPTWEDTAMAFLQAMSVKR